jgi:hypothetical protein
MHTCEVFSTPATKTSRLHDLGIVETVLRAAAEWGLRYTFDCTLHDPPGTAGFLAWSKITRGLRDRLVPQGWKASHPSNFAITSDPRGTYAIAVFAGNAATGFADRWPSNRTDKGPATMVAIQQNQRSFAEISEDFRRLGVPLSTKQTWLLLHFVDEEAEEIRLELSLPAEVSEDGYVVAWRERILLTPISLPSEPVAITDPDDDRIDVDVQRRAN